MPLRRGHLPAKRPPPFAPDAISPNALLPQHRGALGQHALQVDPLPLADLITAAGRRAARVSTPAIEMTDSLIHLHPSGVI